MRAGLAAILCATAGLRAAAASAQAVPRIELRPADAVAAAEFTLVTSVRELRDRSLLVADVGQTQLVHLLWGRVETTVIGRVGDGPGEYRAIGGLFPIGGDSTLLFDTFLHRWTLLAGDRAVAAVGEQRSRTWLLGTRVVGADTSGRVLAAQGVSFRPRLPRVLAFADSVALLLAERGSDRLDTLAVVKGRGAAGFDVIPGRAGRPRLVLFGNPLASEDQALLFPDGWIALALTEPYRVDWRTPGGRWLRGAPLPVAAVRVTDRERCFASARVIGPERPCDPSELRGWPETVPAFLPASMQRLAPALLAAPDGCVVISRTPTAASPGHRYDIVDRSGHLVGVLVLSPDEVLIGFGARFAYTLLTDDLGVQRLRRHPWP